MFLPSISSPTSFSAHQQHTRKNKQQIRYQRKKLPAAGPHGSGPDLLVKGGGCGSLLPGRGPGFDPQLTGVLPAQRNECSTAEQSVGLAPPTITTIPPEDDRCSVRSLQQGESIRHLYNWLRMREKRGGKDGKRGRRKTDCEGVCLHLSEILDTERVFQLPCLCVKTKWEILQRQTDTREGKWENRVAGEEGAEGEVGSWHRWDWLSLNRTSFHTHYTCPLQSSHRTSTGATLSKTGPHFRLMKLPIFYGGVAQPGQRLL